MNTIFTRTDFDDLSTLFDPEARYKGYKPAVRERPNGDTNVDTDKRFLHVALKYDPPEWAVRLLARAHFEACRVVEGLGVCPHAAYPKIENGTLRVLEYPEGAGTAEHRDFDLLTVTMYRDKPNDIEQKPLPQGGWTRGIPPYHMGELGQIFGLGPAALHRVPGRPYVQRAIVYFASPGMHTALPEPITFPAVEGFDEVTVTTTGQWQIERTNRSRVYA
jgi:hypothetical protein